MRRTVRLREEADRDLTDTALWYELQRSRLGHEFLDDALQLIDRIAEQPHSYPVVHRNARRALLSRFPFAVYFWIDDPDIVIFAVIHGSRHPRRWQTRI